MADGLAPITVVTGSEELLVERAVRGLVATATAAADEPPEVQDLEAAGLATGQLAVVASPSLFGGPPIVVLRGIERLVQSDDDMVEPIDEVLGYLRAPSPDACIVLVHAGGNGGKAILTAAKKAGADVLATPTAKKAGEIRAHRRQFVRDEFKSHDCTVSPQAIEVLIEAVGVGLRDLAAACAQLASDRAETNRVDENDVMRYYDGIAEVKTFDVADRVVAGHTAEALGLFRHAREGGAPVVLFPAALARTLRQLALVASAPGHQCQLDRRGYRRAGVEAQADPGDGGTLDPTRTDPGDSCGGGGGCRDQGRRSRRGLCVGTHADHGRPIARSTEVIEVRRPC